MKQVVLDRQKLTEYMKKNGENTSSLAAKLGVTPSCLSRVLNNKRDPSGVVWEGLISLFGKKVFNYIFFEDDVSKDTRKSG
ncbi:hypothetical protein J31TS4_18900 [Paenibacillus sp. J31TS4]|uniref:helix-turn-helix domain-containing protein n=1 Tax=Paenibacillus sp. J31TS4 TaxID=2807195 RepID=UPI001B0A5A4E|nr:helix-turn-helix transcriptional regulator [Paenibacillus sp. J31TS4]GIP38610.1 hypothetical protein J31TS4_18900 [Paenibacillus sp. J31TS4]